MHQRLDKGRPCAVHRADERGCVGREKRVGREGWRVHRRGAELVGLVDLSSVVGEADAERNGIFAEAYGQDIELFEFYRSLSAYELSRTLTFDQLWLSHVGERLCLTPSYPVLIKQAKVQVEASQHFH